MDGSDKDLEFDSKIDRFHHRDVADSITFVKEFGDDSVNGCKSRRHKLNSENDFLNSEIPDFGR
jgi:hypothetical protein